LSYVLIFDQILMDEGEQKCRDHDWWLMIDVLQYSTVQYNMLFSSLTRSFACFRDGHTPPPYATKIWLSNIGDAVAIGAPNNRGNGAGSGHARVYVLNVSKWDVG
jgi:hypothetical protein